MRPVGIAMWASRTDQALNHEDEKSMNKRRSLMINHTLLPALAGLSALVVCGCASSTYVDAQAAGPIKITIYVKGMEEQLKLLCPD